MILNAFFAALGQMGDPRFRKVLFLGVGLTLALLIATYAGFLWLIDWLVGEEATLPVLGEVTWLNDLLSVSSFLFMMVLSIFLMVPVASAITSMFLDEVAQAVEDRHYPALAPAPKLPFLDALWDTLGFLGIIILANLLALILYAFFPPFAPFIFWGMNGFLLGRG
ncbi:EI24 domain-containing protein, partial [Cribrihabitans sp. XS_ASV171]